MFSYQCIHGCPIKVFWNWSISQRGGLFYHALWWSISRGIKPNQTLLLQLKTKWHCRNLGWNLKLKYHIWNTICKVLCNTRDGWQPINSRAWCNNDATGRCVVKSSKSLEDCGPGKTSRLCTCQTRQLLLSLLVQIMHSPNYCNSNWDVRYAEWHVSFLILASGREGQWPEVEDILVEQILFAQRKKEGLP